MIERPATCIRCGRPHDSAAKSVAVYLFGQTVGMRPRLKSSAQRITFCPQCAVSLAMGPCPEGALNVAAWKMICDLVGSDRAVSDLAWTTLHETGPVLAGDTPLQLPG